MRVLHFGAHGDDEVLGVGGTLARYADEGHDGFAAIFVGRMNRRLAETIGTRYDDNVIALRKRQSQEAAGILGLKETRFLDFEDETLDEDLLGCTLATERLIKELKPNVVFIHHRGDSNQDHRGMFKAAIVACRQFAGTTLSDIYCYETLSTTEQSPVCAEYAFLPNYYVNIQSTLERKLDAMKCYKDEPCAFPHPRSLEGIMALARVRGMAVGFTAAEAFMTYRRTCV
ncbi:MAG: hypothetical protein A3K19_13065 [Lentisphaerae bacterium RIFOXYB12_FULL_65_16]|nr:MAG: hypothetical protein A3K18_04640 [Lentisphaerae bacterium RIFOXYA12_64_32]OGV87240.1 MAG: hypothetical protein A3K19_13065 [Lentisphaerae bacterium RIFOXYB12_FULL_65_16]